ncbi:MAG TPA: hypothetical protein VEY88_20205 [Archangium sp.]|nr:hypothetical protein [Archangium sp.]
MQSWLKFAGTTVLALSVSGCPAPETGVAAITLNSSPRYIDDTGQSTTVRVTALDASGQPGKGDVVLTTAAGFLGTDKQKTLTVALDAQGKASASFSCPVAQDTGCKGFVRVEGDWNEVNNGTSVQVTTTTGSTGGGNDAGTNPGGGTDAGTNPGGGTDAGTNPGGGTDAGTNPGGGTEVVGTPANIVFLSSSAKAQLGIRSSGLETATPLTFVVLDLSGNRVKDAEVTFSVVGPAGVTLTALASKTNAQGQATVLLQSGDEVGVATVTARVTGTSLFVSTLGTPIVGARVSDDGFALECQQINLAANASDTPPRLDLGTPCTAKLVDRFTNPVTLSTTVNWYAEAGSIKSPVTNGGTPTGPGSGGGEGNSIAVTAFSTAGKWPPVPVSPLSPAEPSVGTYNPRDMLVTLIAVTTGEEEFQDGSGLSAGVKDGKWTPGEWFVDVPEPFVDANDNQVYDLGEQFIDTERMDCATGMRQAKNGRWDGPNGCWDGDIMLWRPTHILYSGFNNLQPARWSVLAPGALPPPYTVAKGSSTGLNVTVTDAYLNRMSPDSADILVNKVGDRGSATLPYVDGTLNSRTYGFQLFHERVEVAVDASQPRGYRVVGTCDPSKVPSAGASGDPKLARCVRQYRFGQFGGDNVATVALKGADPSDTTPAQRIPVFLTATNAYSTSTFFFDVNFQ